MKWAESKIGELKLDDGTASSIKSNLGQIKDFASFGSTVEQIKKWVNESSSGKEGGMSKEDHYKMHKYVAENMMALLNQLRKDFPTGTKFSF
jgi:hypothetical protein